MRVFELRLRLLLLRNRCGQGRLSLLDLIFRLPLLVSKRGLVFPYLRLNALDCVGVVGAVGFQFVRRHHRDELILLDLIAFPYHQLPDLSSYLWTDNHVLGRDNSGQNERPQRLPHRVISPDGTTCKNEQKDQSLHSK